MAGKITASGGRETADAFDKLAADVRDMPDTHERVARARLGGVAALTPVRSGELRGSWEASGSSTGGSIVSPLAYAPVIEYGSEARGISAVAMVARTLEADQVALLAEYEQAILEAAKRRGFRLA